MKMLIKLLSIVLVIIGIICYIIYSPILMIKSVFDYDNFSEFFEKFCDTISIFWNKI